MPRRALSVTLWLASGAVAAFALLVVIPRLAFRAPTCLVLLLTGVPCPGCGMTRATACLVNGDFESMLRFHPLAPLLMAQAIAGWIWWGLVATGRTPRPSGWWLVGALGVDVAALLVTWLVRLATGTLP